MHKLAYSAQRRTDYHLPYRFFCLCRVVQTQKMGRKHVFDVASLLIPLQYISHTVCGKVESQMYKNDVKPKETFHGIDR